MNAPRTSLTDAPTLILPTGITSRKDTIQPAYRGRAAVTTAASLPTEILAILDDRSLSGAGRLYAIRKAAAACLPLPPCPDWCDGDCNSPDPGVVDHYSKPWTGEDQYDGAKWHIQVTQRYTVDGIEPAVIDVVGVEGTFGSLAAMASDLLAADTLAKYINAGGAR
ncbi:hypothetical protein [Micromonospora sp. NPDC049891]|uniref:hypothetical protein n=1 Tax=Micromonospora sp. NPDC049891 TaxID=3155655 RepID=UPI0033C60139